MGDMTLFTLMLLGPIIEDIYEDIIANLGDTATTPQPDDDLEFQSDEMRQAMSGIRDLAAMFHSLSVSSASDGDRFSIRFVLTLAD